MPFSLCQIIALLTYPPGRQPLVNAFHFPFRRKHPQSAAVSFSLKRMDTSDGVTSEKTYRTRNPPHENPNQTYLSHHPNPLKRGHPRASPTNEKDETTHRRLYRKRKNTPHLFPSSPKTERPRPRCSSGSAGGAPPIFLAFSPFSLLFFLFVELSTLPALSIYFPQLLLLPRRFRRTGRSMQTQRGREITETGIEKLGMGVLSSSILSYLLALACLLACLDMRTCVACVCKRIRRGLWLCV